jgi:hypothetical protein
MEVRPVLGFTRLGYGAGGSRAMIREVREDEPVLAEVLRVEAIELG